MSPDPMPLDQPEKFRSFTVRVPLSLYVRLSQLAQKEGLHLNRKINQILMMGLGEHANVDSILLRLIKQGMPSEPASNE